MAKVRKERVLKENTVLSLHRKIENLEKENQNAKIHVEEVLKNALSMMETKIEKDNYATKLNLMKAETVTEKQELVVTARRSQSSGSNGEKL